MVYWHFVLGHSNEIKPKLYADRMIMLPKNITQKNKGFFCSIYVMGKSTHHVPPPHTHVLHTHAPQVMRCRIEHSMENAENEIVSNAEKGRTSHAFEIISK